MRNIIRTSQPDWFKEALEKYRDRQPFSIVDDAKIGLKKRDLTSGIALIKKKARISSWEKVVVVLASLGISGTGLVLIKNAIKSRNPQIAFTSILAGTSLAAIGYAGMLRAFGKPCKVNMEGKVSGVGYYKFIIEPV